MCELMRYEPLLLLFLLRFLAAPSPNLLSSRRKDRHRGSAAKGDTDGQTHTGQDSFISFDGGLDTCSMYEKLTMLNLQSGSNWSGPNNWYHDPTGVQTQHSTGEWKFISICQCSQILIKCHLRNYK